jgi:hypothetical protein
LMENNDVFKKLYDQYLVGIVIELTNDDKYVVGTKIKYVIDCICKMS